MFWYFRPCSQYCAGAIFVYVCLRDMQNMFRMKVCRLWAWPMCVHLSLEVRLAGCGSVWVSVCLLVSLRGVGWRGPFFSLLCQHCSVGPLRSPALRVSWWWARWARPSSGWTSPSERALSAAAFSAALASTLPSILQCC